MWSSFSRTTRKRRALTRIEMAELSHKFHQAAKDALSGAYPMVEEPGPDVMRLRVAITDLGAAQKNSRYAQKHHDREGAWLG